ncbi:MAG TPA: endonuclease/exonuclease/phosphatase family protein [Saprospiraceae bacterium]|nr:endonuclease/exonuclease/phosphatase family protein [Saprospiraceae bacterium]HRO07988.1 endonuclease/exonuclease/phosphatase family protein [Saprospiraceae bacterium]HRP41483.1 endonuclease/exonuclease/phosphatase family protein [Saprospiraceae bacterium]
MHLLNNGMLFMLFISMFVFTSEEIQAQDKQQYNIISVGFYNLENLFDTVDDTLIKDEEFLPEGARAWTIEKYNEKSANMAYVISQIGIENVKSGLSVLGVSEVENRKVLEDLVAQPSLKDRNYQIIHYNSPDQRGVDVAFLYNPSHFTPITSKPITTIVFDENGNRRKTRDILYVKGLIETDTFHFLVNHWPSRGGGPVTVTQRNNAAKQCRMVFDSIRQLTPLAKVVIMGDLNDDPTSESIKSYLRTVSKIKDVKKTGLFGPFEDFYRRGQGSNAFRDAWSLFDQIIISEGLTDNSMPGYYYFKANIFNKQFLRQPTGQYKGYPFRTFSGDEYQGGYSDHFPTYLYLVKPL